MIRRKAMHAVLMLGGMVGCLLGCGGDGSGPPPRGAVSGKVTVDGEPLKDGAVMFVPAEGPMAKAIVKAGVYSLTDESGPVVGTNKVRIEGYRETGKVYQPPNRTHAIPEVAQYLPAKFNDESTLEIEIDNGSNDGDFNLNTKE